MSGPQVDNALIKHLFGVWIVALHPFLLGAGGDAIPVELCGMSSLFLFLPVAVRGCYDLRKDPVDSRWSLTTLSNRH